METAWNFLGGHKLEQLRPGFDPAQPAAQRTINAQQTTLNEQQTTNNKQRSTNNKQRTNDQNFLKL
ncbi:MAG: hypothetical protein HUU01_17780 [Saprospiraceae bacterium]|nr:hypothetical protein [Saprospiraceae bacterium]